MEKVEVYLYVVGVRYGELQSLGAFTEQKCKTAQGVVHAVYVGATCDTCVSQMR